MLTSRQNRLKYCQCDCLICGTGKFEKINMVFSNLMSRIKKLYFIHFYSMYEAWIKYDEKTNYREKECIYLWKHLNNNHFLFNIENLTHVFYKVFEFINNAFFFGHPRIEIFLCCNFSSRALIALLFEIIFEV